MSCTILADREQFLSQAVSSLSAQPRRAFIRVVVEEELGETEAGERDFGAEADLGADFEGRIIQTASGVEIFEKSCCTAEVSGRTRAGQRETRERRKWFKQVE